MGKPKVEPLLKHKNRFAVLAEDSEDEPDYAPLSPNFGSQDFTGLIPEISKSESIFEEPFAESLIPKEEIKTDGQFRIWKNDVARFSSDTHNIFSSPFSRKGRYKKEDADGWTSIESGCTTEHVQSTQGVHSTQGVQEFPSMFNRGNEVADAIAWADKVKNSLEKVRQDKYLRCHRKEKLSFFSSPIRTIVLGEKF
jgi:hypothetical protein